MATSELRGVRHPITVDSQNMGEHESNNQTSGIHGTLAVILFTTLMGIFVMVELFCGIILIKHHTSKDGGKHEVGRSKEDISR